MVARHDAQHDGPVEVDDRPTDLGAVLELEAAWGSRYRPSTPAEHLRGLFSAGRPDPPLRYLRHYLRPSPWVAEEGVVDLDEPAGPPGSTVRHLLAHASGLPFEGTTPIAQPGRRRIYSNEAFRVLAELLAAHAEMPFAEYVDAAVCAPLGIGLDPLGDPGSGMHASLEDVLALGRELLHPRLLAPETRDEMTSVQFPGLAGVLPDHGRFDPLDWGLGVQLNTPTPSGMGSRVSRRAYGHFGGSGTFRRRRAGSQARVQSPCRSRQMRS